MSFTLQLIESHWLQEAKDNPEDLCSHGFVLAIIDNETVCDPEMLDVTTSAAALHLMRALKQDYNPGMFAGQLLPCCGHFVIAGDDLLKADIHGCPSGIDWHVKHLDGFVKLTSGKGTVALVPLEDYRQQVFAFADAVEVFYSASSPKILPDDAFSLNGYKAFWNEWRILREGF